MNTPLTEVIIALESVVVHLRQAIDTLRSLREDNGE